MPAQLDNLPEVIDLTSKARNDFFQSRVWVQYNGTPIYTWDMSLEHLTNTIRMLQRNAYGIHDAHVNWMIRLGSYQEFERLLEADPWEWLKNTPLVKAMRKARKRRLRGKEPRRYCEHSYTGKDFCGECSDAILDSLVPSGGPGD